jgi:BON domain
VPAVPSSQAPSDNAIASSNVAPTPANPPHKTVSHHSARTSESTVAAVPGATDTDSANRVAANSPPPPAAAASSGDAQPNAAAPAPAPAAGSAADATVAATAAPAPSPTAAAASSDTQSADSAPASDSAIAKAAQSEIAADSSNSGANVAVTSQDGVVILSGTVPSQDALNRVKAAAARVKDVKSVDSSAVIVAGS